MDYRSLLPIALLAACSSQRPMAPAAASPAFDPITFFSGRTEGRGRIRILWRAPVPILVHGSGRIEPDGSLILDQRIERKGHRPEQRQWRIRRAGGGRYSATLTTARDPVRVSVDGNLLRIDARLNGVSAHQDIWLAPDGRSALNHMRMTKFGIPVATIEERISRAD